MDGEPLYLTARQAAAAAGIGVNEVRDMLNSSDPPPFLEVGVRRMIQAASWPAYLEARQTVRDAGKAVRHGR